MAPFDPFRNVSDSLISTARAPYPVLPDDDAPLPSVPKGIFVGTGGDVTLRGIDGSQDVTYRNLPDASYIAVRASHVRATGTTAADMIAEA